MLDSIVVDDEFHAVERLKELIVETQELNLLKGYTEVDNCLTDIKEENIKPEVVFLDIEMPGYNGLQLAQRILDFDKKIDVVFVTAYDNYAVDAFELNALDYLLKPITKDRLQKTIKRLDVNEKDNDEDKNFALKVISLGDCKISVHNEEPDIEWPTVKTKECFLYLLYHRGNFVERDKIVDALWSDKDFKRAVDILYTTIYSLRKLFNELGLTKVITSKRGFYGLNLDKIYWDVIEFENIVDKLKDNLAKDIQKVERMIELYQGEFLLGQTYKWAHALRVKLKEDFQTILLKIADYYEQAGEYEKAINILKKVIRESFLLERAYKKLIEIYIEVGDKTSARKEYQNLKTRMNNEFGIEPQIDFVELKE